MKDYTFGIGFDTTATGQIEGLLIVSIVIRITSQGRISLFEWSVEIIVLIIIDIAYHLIHSCYIIRLISERLVAVREVYEHIEESREIIGRIANGQTQPDSPFEHFSSLSDIPVIFRKFGF